MRWMGVEWALDVEAGASVPRLVSEVATDREVRRLDADIERLAALGGVYAAEARVKWMKAFIADMPRP